jgi:hypothetical protein
VNVAILSFPFRVGAPFDYFISFELLIKKMTATENRMSKIITTAAIPEPGF